MKTILKEPNLYDMLYRDVTQDIQLYLTLCEKYNKVIEYGAGTGRVTIPLAQSGKVVYAIDNEELMLEKLKNNLENQNAEVSQNVKIIKSDMIVYKHIEEAECIIMPLTVFNYILTTEEQDKCLSNACDSLKVGGKLIMELLTKDTFKELNKQENYEYIKKLTFSDGYYEYWRKTKLEDNIMIQDRKFKLYDEDGNFIKEENMFWKNRFVSISEITLLLEKHGFYIANIYGSCDLELYTESSEDIFIEAIKK